MDLPIFTDEILIIKYFHQKQYNQHKLTKNGINQLISCIYSSLFHNKLQLLNSESAETRNRFGNSSITHFIYSLTSLILSPIFASFRLTCMVVLMHLQN